MPLRQFSYELLKAEQHERERLAGLLHDDLQQILVAVKITAEQLLVESRGREKSTQLIEKGMSQLQNAIEVTRTLSAELNPPALNESGLIAALEWLKDWMAKNHHFQVKVNAPSSLKEPSPEIKSVIFQSIRELLLNAVKHSGSSEAYVILGEGTDGRIRVNVMDHGNGFDSKESHTENGVGLRRLRQRLKALGGSVRIHSTPGHGMKFSFETPLSP